MRRVRWESFSSELIMCGIGVRSILLLPLVALPIDNRCVYKAHVCFYVCYSNIVRVCENGCCVKKCVFPALM